MSGLYPTDEMIDIYGKQVKFPGLGLNGKYTNGDFSDPLVPPSRLDAGTWNLILDNLNSFISKLGETPNNTGLEQLANLFTSVAVANKGVMRDSAGRAKMATPVAADDIAVLNTVYQFCVCSSDANRQTKTASIAGFVLTAGAKIMVKFNNGLTVAHPTLDISNTGAKDIYCGTYKLGIGGLNAGITYEFVYDGTAWQIQSDIVTSVFNDSFGYIKYRNGFLIQWGNALSANKTYFPIANPKNYFLFFGWDTTPRAAGGYSVTAETRDTTSFLPIVENNNFHKRSNIKLFFLSIGV